MNYGRAIRVVRNACGLNQTELASRLDVGASHLSLIEAGKRRPSVKLLADISFATGVPVHLIALLASEPSDLEREENVAQVNALAQALLRVLVGGPQQPTLPIKTPKKSA